MTVPSEMMRSVLEEWPSGLQLKEILSEFSEVVGVEDDIELFFDGRVKDLECTLVEFLLHGTLLVGLYSQALGYSKPRLVHGLLDVLNIWTLLMRTVTLFLLRSHDEATISFLFLEPQPFLAFSYGCCKVSELKLRDIDEEVVISGL